MFSLLQWTMFHRMHVTVCKDTAMCVREKRGNKCGRLYSQRNMFSAADVLMCVTGAVFGTVCARRRSRCSVCRRNVLQTCCREG